MKRLCSLVICCLLCVGAGVLTAQEVDRGFSTTVGGTLSISRLESAANRDLVKSEAPKAVLLHFVDCENERCSESLTAIEEFIAVPLAGEPVEITAIAVGSHDKAAEDLARELGLSFRIVADPARKIFLSVATDGIPRTIILNDEEKIVYQHGGYRPGREAEFRVVIESILEGQAAPVAGAGLGLPNVNPKGFSEELYAIDVRGEKAPAVPVETWINPIPSDIDGKFRLIDFWATWCGPCRTALELGEKIHHQFDDRLVTMAISDEDPATVRSYVESTGLKQPIGTDTQARAKTALGVRGIPHAIVINPDGKVVWQGHPMSLWNNNGALMREVLNGREFGKAGAAEE